MTRLTFFALILFITNCAFANGKIIVKVNDAKEAEFYKQVSLPAECVSLESRDYVSRADGFVDDIPAGHKTDFKKGELILAIDKTLSESQKSQAESDFKSASATYERDKTLFSKQIISTATLEKSKTAYYSAKSRLAEAEKIYENKVIYAPFDGTISHIKFKVGEHVKTGEFLFNITGGAEKLIRFAVPQNYKIDSGADGEISHSGKKYNLSKISISKTLANNFGHYPATAVVLEDNKLEHNSYISISLNYGKHKAIGVPETAVIKKDGESKLFIVNSEGKAEILTVEVADRTNGLIEITSGNIPVGTKIVTSGIQKLNGGEPLEITE